MGREIDRSIKDLNTFGIDVTTHEYQEFTSVEELHDIFKDINTNWMVIGGGSNLLFTRNWEGLLLKSAILGVEKVGGDDKSQLLKIGSGMVWDDFCAYACNSGLWGVENLSNIPGSIGAAPVQNVGAYGTEAGDVIDSVIYFDTKELVVKDIKGSDCKFGYRDSIFKRELKDRAIVIYVVMRLSLVANANLAYGSVADKVEELGGCTLQNIRQAVSDIRNEKLPDPKVIGNGGSFFKNPVVDSGKYRSLIALYPTMPSYKVGSAYKIPAAWLIEQAGWKGRREADAGVHHTQPLVLVNYGDATGAEILELSERIMLDVATKFGVALDREINII